MQKFLNKVLAVDGSYMLHRSLKAPDLWELKNKQGLRTGGVYGFLKSFQFAMKECEYFPVICWDSGQSPRRLEVYPNYKHRLDKSLQWKADKLALMLLNREISDLPAETTLEERKAVEEAVARMENLMKLHGSYQDPDDYVDQYLRQRDLIISICHSLGVPSILMPKWEGDDLITLLTRISRKSIIVTDDKDMWQLISPDTEIYRAMARQRLQYESFLQEKGADTPREFVIAKAISGDPSDNIPSVTSGESERKYRAGEVTACRIAKIIAECKEDQASYTKALMAITDRDRNKIQGFLRNHAVYERNMKLVDLSLVEDDLQTINAMIAEIRSMAGKTKFFDVISKLGELEINTVDIQSIIAAITARFRQNF